MYSAHLYTLCVCVRCLEWTHRPAQKKEFSVHSNTKITGKKERNNVSSHWISSLLLCGCEYPKCVGVCIKTHKMTLLMLKPHVTYSYSDTLYSTCFPHKYCLYIFKSARNTVQLNNLNEFTILHQRRIFFSCQYLCQWLIPGFSSPGPRKRQ